MKRKHVLPTTWIYGVRCIKCKKMAEFVIERDGDGLLAEREIDRMIRDHGKECRGMLTRYEKERE